MTWGGGRHGVEQGVDAVREMGWKMGRKGIGGDEKEGEGRENAQNEGTEE